MTTKSNKRSVPVMIDVGPMWDDAQEVPCQFCAACSKRRLATVSWLREYDDGSTLGAFACAECSASARTRDVSTVRRNYAQWEA